MKAYEFQDVVYCELKDAVKKTLSAETPYIDKEKVREEYRQGLLTISEYLYYIADKEDKKLWKNAAYCFDKSNNKQALLKKFGIKVIEL